MKISSWNEKTVMGREKRIMKNKILSSSGGSSIVSKRCCTPYVVDPSLNPFLFRLNFHMTIMCE